MKQRALRRIKSRPSRAQTVIRAVVHEVKFESSWAMVKSGLVGEGFSTCRRR